MPGAEEDLLAFCRIFGSVMQELGSFYSRFDQVVLDLAAHFDSLSSNLAARHVDWEELETGSDYFKERLLELKFIHDGMEARLQETKVPVHGVTPEKLLIGALEQLSVALSAVGSKPQAELSFSSFDDFIDKTPEPDRKLNEVKQALALAQSALSDSQGFYREQNSRGVSIIKELGFGESDFSPSYRLGLEVPVLVVCLGIEKDLENLLTELSSLKIEASSDFLATVRQKLEELAFAHEIENERDTLARYSTRYSGESTLPEDLKNAKYEVMKIYDTLDEAVNHLFLMEHGYTFFFVLDSNPELISAFNEMWPWLPTARLDFRPGMPCELRNIWPPNGL